MQGVSGFLSLLVAFSIALQAAETQAEPKGRAVSTAGKGAPLTESLHLDKTALPGNGLTNFPSGDVALDGIRFKVSGVAQLHGTKLEENGTRAAKEVSFPVNDSGSKIHLLHGTAFTDKPGRKIATLVISLADGTKVEKPIIYAGHVRDWWGFKDEDVKDKDSKVVWTGENEQSKNAKATLRIYRSTFSLEKASEIASVTVRSENAMSAPFVLGVSVE